MKSYTEEELYEHMKGFAEFLANHSIWRNGKEGNSWYTISGLFKGDRTTEQLIELYFDSLNK